MQFDTLSEFLNMGGYAFYVWLAYGITFASLGILVIHSMGQKRRILTEIAKKIQREERLKENRSTKS